MKLGVNKINTPPPATPLGRPTESDETPSRPSGGDNLTPHVATDEEQKKKLVPSEVHVSTALF